MLVRFKSQAGQAVLMFGEDARALLLLMGMSGEIPGAVAHEDVLTALDRLNQSLQQGNSKARPTSGQGTDDKASEVPVGMSVRAYPLVKLLELAARHKHAVVWETASA